MVPDDAKKQQSETHETLNPMQIVRDPREIETEKAELEGTAEFHSNPEPEIDPHLTATFVFSPTIKAKSDSKSSPLQIPGYQILGELGRGAMGVVYAARQIRADRIVALKVMLNLDHANAESVERFKVEAQAVARLQHPNIVQVHDVNEAAGCPYFTLEYVSGGTLSRKISGQLPTPRDSAALLMTLAEAMEFAHNKGIIHRDLKPANILIDANGQPKIADFGLARRLEDTTHLTQDGTAVGTPSYMAPEQTLGDSDAINPLVDVYALGAILYELLAGRPPFKGASSWEIIRQVRYDDPVRPTELRPGVPLDLETICLKCLQKEPARRYASALALQQDLQRFLNNEPILARPIGQWGRLVRLYKRHPREAILIGSLALVLAIVAIGASIAAYRISQDRDMIAGQNIEIEKQRDQIQQEKDLSDDRLTIYRDTVSSLVNRAPRLLESSPIGGSTKRELTELLNQVLSKSSDENVVGSSKQWGVMAVHLRQGETLMAEAANTNPTQVEILQAKLAEAKEEFDAAVALAKSIYESDEPDRAKAASNYSIVLARLADAIFHIAPAKWKEVVPLYKQSIQLAEEAVESTQTSHDDATLQSEAAIERQHKNVGYELKRADRVYQYSTFLMKVAPADTGFQNRALELLQAAQDLHHHILDRPSLPANLLEESRHNLGLVYKLLAKIHIARGDADKTLQAFEQSVACFQFVVAQAPYRMSFQRNLSNVANDFGQHLLLTGGDPERAREMYQLARQGLELLTRTSDVKLIEQHGLVIQWYALGLIAEREAKPTEAVRCYLMAASIRERHYRESEDDELRGKSQDHVKTLGRLVEWNLCLARAGQREAVLNHVKRIYTEIVSLKLDPEHSQPLLVTSAAAMGILAQHSPEGSADRQSLTAKAVQLLEKSIEYGYRDADYLQKDPDFEWLAKTPQIDKMVDLIRRKE